MKKYVRLLAVITTILVFLNLGSVYAADILDVTIRGDYKGDLGKFLSQTIYYVDGFSEEEGKYVISEYFSPNYINMDYARNFAFAYAFEHGYAMKDSKGRYYTDKLMKVDEFAYYLYKYVFKEKVKVNTTAQVFANVPKNSPYFKAVAALKDYLIPLSRVEGKYRYLFDYFSLDEFIYLISRVYNIKVQITQKEALDFLKKNRITDCDSKYAVYVAQVFKSYSSFLLLLKYIEQGELGELSLSGGFTLHHFYIFLCALDTPILDTEDKLYDYLARYGAKDYGKHAYYIAPKKYYTDNSDGKFDVIESEFNLALEDMLAYNIAPSNLFIDNIQAFL